MKLKVRILPNGLLIRKPPFTTHWFFDRNGKFICSNSNPNTDEAIRHFLDTNTKRN